jgi:hypothetical protein
MLTHHSLPPQQSLHNREQDAWHLLQYLYQNYSELSALALRTIASNSLYESVPIIASQVGQYLLVPSGPLRFVDGAQLQIQVKGLDIWILGILREIA